MVAWAGMGKARHAGPGGMGELRQSVKVGKLNLVDLAGSERVHITGATGQSWLLLLLLLLLPATAAACC